ncbi:MAG: hypothetical protein K5912_02850 [Alphaproteobacteria bacterium]|nr:hypothetical protein [Alphaproteobacteria bacterium]
MNVAGKKFSVIPVSVSDITPVYNDGQLIAYNLRVFYDGDLSVNTSSRKAWDKFIDKNPHLIHKEYNMLRPVLRNDIIIPKERHLTGLFRYHDEKAVSELEYSWRCRVFNGGLKRAEKFRQKMLVQIYENNK